MDRCLRKCRAERNGGLTNVRAHIEYDAYILARPADIMTQTMAVTRCCDHVSAKRPFDYRS